MIIIPAIDLMNGHCVRLSQGDFDTRVSYSDDPLSMAQYFEKMGFTHLHMVDLDGARAQQPRHLEVLQAVSGATQLQVDFSGGIRSLEQALEVLQSGAAALTLGSMAVKDPDTTLKILRSQGPQKVILGADVRDGFISTHGWTTQSALGLFDFLEQWLAQGFQRVMITDVSRDGMLNGPALELYQSVLGQFPQVELIASGGIAQVDDLIALRQMGCYAAITGKALYEKAFDWTALKQLL